MSLEARSPGAPAERGDELVPRQSRNKGLSGRNAKARGVASRPHLLAMTTS